MSDYIKKHPGIIFSVIALVITISTALFGAGVRYGDITDLNEDIGTVDVKVETVKAEIKTEIQQIRSEQKLQSVAQAEMNTDVQVLDAKCTEMDKKLDRLLEKVK
jgi:hypothetical protein